MDNAVVRIKKGEGRTIKAGGFWVYDNEIDGCRGAYENGDIVAVEDFDGYFLGWGFINDHSKIRVRLMSRRREHVVNRALLRRRVEDAWQLRKATTDIGCCRVIFGEADYLPGLTVDKFSDVLVVESLALGIDRLKHQILDELMDVMAKDDIVIHGIYERSDARVRVQEGMERFCGFISEPFDTKVPICENGVNYLVDVAQGQKTGFFLDQKGNRAAIARLCKGGRVLDCFTHTGSFALNAGKAGAREVLGVDASDLAIAQARENAVLNGLEEIVSFETADVFDLLPRLQAQGEVYDVVILDPPAFTKSRASIKNAVKGYREINMRGIKLVRNGGFLATCSCSHFMDPQLFAKTIYEAAHGAHRTLRQLEFRTQACDHPIMWNNDSSYYLKFYIFQVVDEL